MARLLLRTGRALVAAPARWRLWQWTSCIALLAATALAWVDERPLQALVQGRGGAGAGVLAGAANLAGSGLAVTLLGAGALVAGRVLRKDGLEQAAVVLAVAGLWGLLLVEGGQFVLAERRPLEGGAMRFLALGGHGVSGHVAATALLVRPVRDVWLRRASPLRRNLATIALIAWTMVVGWSRVWLGMHFAWNVLAGAAMGAWAGGAAVAAWRELEWPAESPARPPPGNDDPRGG